jgi:hypothetical protein
VRDGDWLGVPDMVLMSARKAVPRREEDVEGEPGTPRTAVGRAPASADELPKLSPGVPPPKAVKDVTWYQLLRPPPPGMGAKSTASPVDGTRGDSAGAPASSKEASEASASE